MKIDANSTAPLVLFATERSGSNLLRAILSSHSKIASPTPAGLVAALAPHSHQYTSSAGRVDIETMIDHAIALTQLHWSPWEVDVDPEQIRQRMVADSFWALFRALNEVYAEQRNCPIWLTKEPQALLWWQQFADHLPGAQSIVLVRDGRDVATSMLKSQLHEFHVFSAADIWAREQKAAREMLEGPQFRDRTICIRYEDLITDPRLEISRLTEFLGLEFEERMVEYYRDPANIEYSKSTDLWKNIRNPISKESVGKFRSVLSRRQIRIFEAEAWEELSYFGYATEFAHRPSLSKVRRRLLRIWTRLLRESQIRFSSEFRRRRLWREQVRAIQKFQA